MLARAPRNFVTMLFLLMVGSAFVCAQGTRGVVVDQTNLPLPGVRIELVRDDRVVEVLMTEADGTFEIPAFQPGDRLDAILDGFEERPTVSAGDARRWITMVVEPDHRGDRGRRLCAHLVWCGDGTAGQHDVRSARAAAAHAPAPHPAGPAAAPPRLFGDVMASFASAAPGRTSHRCGSTGSMSRTR